MQIAYRFKDYSVSPACEEKNKMEKRKHPRFIKRLEARLGIDQTSFWSISRDLSESGLFIRTNRVCSVDTPIDIELSLPGNRISFLKGIVRRAIRTPIPMMQNGIGIEIVEKDKSFRDFVKSISGKTNGDIAEKQTPPALQIIPTLNYEVSNNDTKKTIQERRLYKRIKVENLEVNSEMPSATYVKIIDISKSGVFVKADRKLDIGKKYALKIEYENKVVFVKAAVAWSLLEDNAEDANGNIVPIYIAGMQFANVLKGEITEIISLIEIDINTRSYVSVL
jgi:Tfp pilus assembly protein PilZ